VPTTDIVKFWLDVDGEVVKSRIDVCEPPADRKTVDGIRWGIGGVIPEVNSVAVRFTFPENPFRLVRMIVDVALAPAGTERNEGFALIVKSG
jgi:hypothetical protein